MQGVAGAYPETERCGFRPATIINWISGGPRGALMVVGSTKRVTYNVLGLKLRLLSTTRHSLWFQKVVVDVFLVL
jgi:hypothetical protein